MSKKAPSPSPAPVRAALVLLGLGLAESALAVFQWMQLLTLRSGGATVCGVSERVNCETVWNSPFASTVHETLRVPVAGLGLAWGVAAVGLAALYLLWARRGRDVRPAVNGLRLVAVAGLGASVVFAAASASAGALCPTCLATYALTLGFAGVAGWGLPGPVLPKAGEWGRALQLAVGFAAVGYALVLVPGLRTPRAASGLEESVLTSTRPTGAVADVFQGMTLSEQKKISQALALYRQRTPQAPFATARRLYGPADAPVKMVEWTDSRCPHCKSLVEALALMKKRLPEGKLSLEARQFPLDSECNPLMPPQATDGSGTRCAAAKGQICLEDAPDYWELREKLFAAQRSLTSRDVVLDILSSGSVSRTQLDACIANPDTTRKLREDIQYAQRHNLHGTPLVLINGREATAGLPAFLYALILADGNPDAEGFGALPAAGPLQADDGHGH